MDVEHGIVTVRVDSDSETLLDLIKRENVGNGVGAVPHRAKVSNVPHLCGRVRPTISLDGVRVSTGSYIGKERSVVEDVGGSPCVKDDPRLGERCGRQKRDLHVGCPRELGKRKMAAVIVNGELHEFMGGGGYAVGGRRWWPT